MAAVDQSGRVFDDAAFVLADDRGLSCDVNLCAKGVCRLDQMCDRAGGGGEIPVVPGIIHLLLRVLGVGQEEITFPDLTLEIRVQ